MKNSHRSDKELAHLLGTSRAVVSRLIKKLEKDGCIGEFTVIPNFAKLGFEVMAVTLIKGEKSFTNDEYDVAINAGMELERQEGLPVVMVVKGLGLSYDVMIVSFHRDYTQYRELVVKLRQLFCVSSGVDVQSFIVDLADYTRYRPLTFTALADYLGRLAAKASS
jgi:DNA-binding Lrp family transcriptional regulator